MSIKKLAIYICILVVMLGATGFLLRQNYNLSNHDSAPINNPALTAESIEAQTAIPGSETTSSQPAIDLTIFGNEKFKALQENVLIPQDKSNAGKRDPFQPD